MIPEKRCEAVVSGPLADTCDATELAAHDVWSVFCDGGDSVGNQVVDYSAGLSCAGACGTDSNMTLRVSWISRVSDSDVRTSATVEGADGVEVPSNLDFITLSFRP